METRLHATTMITRAISEQVRLMEESDRLMQLTQPIVSSRVEAHHHAGAMIYQRMLIKYKAQRDRAVQAVDELQALAMEVRYSACKVEYLAQIHGIRLGNHHATVALDQARQPPSPAEMREEMNDDSKESQQLLKHKQQHHHHQLAPCLSDVPWQQTAPCAA